MHMSDALISPGVGAAAWAAMAGGVGWASRRLTRGNDPRRVPLMGVMGAFVFAAQMVNFSIPGTGSSGHLGGGLLLAILLGPDAALLVMTSVLVVQALLFADGGLLALGCNVVNLGMMTSWLAYPLVFRPLAGDRPGPLRLGLASVAAALVGLQLGSLGVVLETTLSRQVSLPLPSFLGLMQSIHLAIGLVEGLATAAVVQALWKARPDLADATFEPARTSLLRAALVVAAAAALFAGGLSQLASQSPDGLEWALEHSIGTAEPQAPAHAAHALAASAQAATAKLPDYGGGSPLAGLLGAGVTLVFALLVGLGIRALRRRTPDGAPAP